MYDSETLNELNRLNFEDFLWIIFAALCIANVYGDYNDKEYLKTHNPSFQARSNQVFEFTLIVTFFIYIYFLSRNYKFYQKVPEHEKQLYLVKVLGSCFLLAGSICLIYFQTRQNSFLGSPAL